MFTILIGSHVAYGNIEFSGHFGKKFGGEIEFSVGNETLKTGLKNQPWHLGVDTFYRFSMETASLGFGLRYRFDFQGEKELTVGSLTSKYKFTTHRIAFLANYRFHIDQFFVGAVIGLDIWKYLKLTIKNSQSSGEGKGGEFLWNQLSGQLGLEFGFMPTSNFLLKLEAGYDLFSFTDKNMEYTGDDAPTTNTSRGGIIKINGFYITLGIGLLLG